MAKSGSPGKPDQRRHAAGDTVPAIGIEALPVGERAMPPPAIAVTPSAARRWRCQQVEDHTAICRVALRYESPLAAAASCSQKAGTYLIADLVGLRTNRRPRARPAYARPGKQHGGHAGLDHAGTQAAPAGMDGGQSRRRGAEQNRQAIRVKPRTGAGRRRPGGVGGGVSAPCPTSAATVPCTCCNQTGSAGSRRHRRAVSGDASGVVIDMGPD